MKKVKRRFKKIVNTVANDLIDWFLFFFDFPCASTERKMMLAWFGPGFDYKKINVFFHRRYREGYIFKIKKKGRLYFRINPSKRYALLDNYLDLKIKKAKERWDKKWRLIIYDIPEKNRILRIHLMRRLRSLGFGKLQKSSWVSPYDYSDIIYEICKSKGIMNYICIYEGKFFAGKDIDTLIEDAWNLSVLKDKYLRIISQSEELIDRIKSREEIKDIYGDYLSLCDLFKATAVEDPFLPPSFLIKWPYIDAEKKLKELTSVILAQSKSRIHHPLQL
jgi:phenylacetic acid degradation operon negative regulatory protein